MPSVKKIAVFGERCSGTTYLERLLETNFGLPITDEYGLKHYWLVKEDLLPTADDTLFVCIERDLLPWLDSFARNPHQVRPYTPNDYEHLFFSRVRSYWNYEVVEDWDNIIEGRRTKSNLILGLKEKVKNYYFIKYEDLVADFEAVLLDIEKKFGLIPKLIPYKNWVYWKSANYLFTERQIQIPKEVIERLKNIYNLTF